TGYVFDKAATGDIPATAKNGDTIKVYYTINSYKLTINYLYADNTVASAPYSETLKYNTSYDVASPAIEGYTADKIKVAGTMGTEDIVVNVIYTANLYDYTVNYYYDNGKDDAAAVTAEAAFGTEIASYADKVKTGYVLDKVEGSPLKVTADRTKNVINVYYVRAEFGYTINYFYDGVKDEKATVTGTKKYAESVDAYENKLKDGYKLEKVEGLVNGKLPITADPAKNVIDVYYVKDSFNYTIEYYYNNVLNADATVTSKALFGSSVTAYTDKNITGYKLDRVVGTPLTITSDEAKNVIRVYYVPAEYTVTVQYYTNNAIVNNLTYTFDAVFGTTVNTYNQVTIDGFVFTRVENLGLKVSENEADNIIRVYYTEVAADEEEVTKPAEKPSGEVAADEDEVVTPLAEVAADEDSVQTADMNNVLVLIAMMIAAGCAVIATVKKRVQEK
ncbi:MAG: MucBP domain-containing protein, partial [Eubacteriales bacterium]|nr:MucBP domain-containing protein [Eubacteriales bacterium]